MDFIWALSRVVAARNPNPQLDIPELYDYSLPTNMSVTELSALYLQQKYAGVATFDQIAIEVQNLEDEIIDPLSIGVRGSQQEAEQDKFYTMVKKSEKMPSFNWRRDTLFNSTYSFGVYQRENPVRSKYGTVVTEKFASPFFMNPDGHIIQIPGIRIPYSPRSGQIYQENINPLQAPSYSFLYGTNSATMLDSEAEMNLAVDLINNRPKALVNLTIPSRKTDERVTRGIRMNQTIHTLKNIVYGNWERAMATRFQINGGTLSIAVNFERDENGIPKKRSNFKEIRMFFDDKLGALASADLKILGEDFRFNEIFKQLPEGEIGQNPDSRGFVYEIISDDMIYAVIAQYISQYRTEAFHLIESITKNVAEGMFEPALLATSENLKVGMEILTSGDENSVVRTQDGGITSYCKTDICHSDGTVVEIYDIMNVTSEANCRKRVMILPGATPIVIMAAEEDGEVSFGWEKLAKEDLAQSSLMSNTAFLQQLKPYWNVTISKTDLRDFLSIGTSKSKVDLLNKAIPIPVSKNLADLHQESVYDEIAQSEKILMDILGSSPDIRSGFFHDIFADDDGRDWDENSTDDDSDYPNEDWDEEYWLDLEDPDY